MAFVVIALWFALSLYLNLSGVFLPDPDSPPLALLLAVIGPALVFGALYAVSGAFRRYVLGFDLTLLTALQAWRILGAMFLVLMFYGLLPGSFAWPAGVGDVIVGAYAPFVAVAIVRRSWAWRQQAILLNILGLLDFVGAIGSGVLSGSGPLGILSGAVTTDIMQTLPLALIPTFAVPLWIVLHIISLLKLTRADGGA